MSAESAYDPSADTGAVQNDYQSRPGQKEAGVPVQADEVEVEDPIDPETADSDEALGTLLTFNPSFSL